MNRTDCLAPCHSVLEKAGALLSITLPSWTLADAIEHHALPCAGLALGVAPIHELELDDSVRMINTNVTAVAILTRIFAEGMKKRNRGHIGKSLSGSISDDLGTFLLAEWEA